MNPMLQGKVVVVAGAGGLIGRAFVRSIVAQGGTAVAADLDEAAGTRLVQDMLAHQPGCPVLFWKTDITSKQSLAALIAALHEKYGRIDALVNSAYPRNPNYGRKFEDVTFEDFSQNVSMHLGGCFLAAQQFVAYFRSQGHGSIVNMASIYGVIAPRFDIYSQTAMTVPVEYAAIKSAVIHLTKYMARYLKGTHIRINCISPGGILDGQPKGFLERYKHHALSKGMLETDDLQGTLLFLLSDLSQFVNGQNIVVDDGWSL